MRDLRQPGYPLRPLAAVGPVALCPTIPRGLPLSLSYRAQDNTPKKWVVKSRRPRSLIFPGFHGSRMSLASGNSVSYGDSAMRPETQKNPRKNLLEEHFRRPKNAGSLPTATHRARVENPVCGDVLEVALRVERGVVREARFLAQACSATMALASLATEKAVGLRDQEIFSWAPSELRSWVGGLPRAKQHAAEVVCRALRTALDSKAEG